MSKRPSLKAPLVADIDGEIRLGYLIHDVSRLRRTLFDKWLAPLGITRSQWWVLAFLSRKDGMPQTELALELDVGKVALGALIHRLEEAGFVERKSDPTDRRAKRVVLTKRSLALLETLRAKNDEFNRLVLDGIAPDDIDVTTRTLRLMKHNLIAGTRDGEPPDKPQRAARRRTPPTETGAGRPALSKRAKPSKKPVAVLSD